MYGISNSQQQGGGGGGAASYKAIKSSIAPSDWQEVGKQAFFVGENAMTWTVNAHGEHEKSQTTKLGLVSGSSYTITAVCDGQTYTQTAVAAGDEVDGIEIEYDFAPRVNIYVYIYDDNDMGSICAINGEVTSFVITKFEGGGFGKTIQATISDSAIKVNSAVTMYTNTSEKIAVGEKTSGSVTLTADSIPTTDIPYSLEIVGTDTEGLFEIVNGYIPEIPDTPSGAPQWHTIFESATPVVTAEIGQNKIQPGQLYRVTVDMSGEANPDQYNVYTATAPDDYSIPFSQVDVSGSSPSSVNVTVFRIEYTTTTSGVIHLSPIARYEVTSAGITNFIAVNNVDAWKFTKLEVYR